jgi:hypothetical protein
MAAGQQGGHKPGAVQDSGLLTKLVSAHPDATLAELQEWLTGSLWNAGKVCDRRQVEGEL